MCGIVGFTLGAGGKGFLSPRGLGPLMDAMAFRGPDGEGVFIDDQIAMGMRRLSIIDLAGGWQPLYSRDERVVAFQNGEIYNHQTLRSELEGRGYRFKTQSDTEVIAHGYDCWGMEGLLARLDGMYAIALLDRDTGALYLARDRLGEKPLYYSHAAGIGFAYGSSMLQVASMPWIEDRPDGLAYDRYLAMHFCPGERTLFDQIRRVLPGELITVTLEGLKVSRTRYWQPRLGRTRDIGLGEMREIVERAVTSRMVADVPVGVFLSGGLDSSIVAAVAASRNARIDTFSMGFGDSAYDESGHARAVASAIGSTHHEFQFGLDRFMDLHPEVADALDEPVGDQAMLPVYWLAREARKHVTVVLAGEGADEVFCGYGYYAPFLGSRQSPPEDRLIDERSAALQSGFPILSGRDERVRTMLLPAAGDPDVWERDLAEWLNAAADPLQRASAADLATWLPDDLLVKFDRMAMAHSLEGRAPFLSPEIVQAGLDLPAAKRMTKSVSKVILREAGRSLLPAELIDRRKQGFVLPMKSWLKEWFEAYGSPASFFYDHEMPGIDPGMAAQIVNQDLSDGLNRERFIFALVMIHVWWKSFARRRRELSSLLVAA
jgi:asparagine synthase (glutamine-hydrolysing)